MPIAAFAQDSIKYSYAIISQDNNVIYITEGPDSFKYEVIKEGKEKDPIDQRPLLRYVAIFEDQGWEVMTYATIKTTTGYPTGQFALRRRR